MPATFETLDAARVLIDYAQTACDPATVKTLFRLLEVIAKDLEPKPKSPAANSGRSPHSHKPCSQRGR